MKHAETVTFGGSSLNRAAELRSNPEEILALAQDPSARCVPIWQGKPLFGRTPRQLGWLPLRSEVLKGALPLIFLGIDTDGPRFARDMSSWEPDEIPETISAFFDPSEQIHPDLGEDYVFAELRGVMTHLSPREAELIASAKAVMAWHATHQFCSKCGERSDMAQSGWIRICPGCEAHHFPRTDPVVIMLITYGNNVLVGRSPGWPEAMYSLLAGFVEPGETLEAAVRRETFEEAGITVGAVKYLASQPWPFPSSLMVGCHGEATSEDITVDPVELDDAKWVSREEMMRVFAGEVPEMTAARKGSIAHFLLSHWLADTLD
jgi:NAD+ diphosphatase